MRAEVINLSGRYIIRVQSPSGIWVRLDGYCDTREFAVQRCKDLGYIID